MTTKTPRQPKGVPVGGQFAATAHEESPLTLTPPARDLPELGAYGDIPAPLDGQTLENGEPAAATFQESYREYFRSLDEHEAAHGPYTDPAPLSEGEILDLAGIRNENLGRHRGTYLERDEDTGEPAIVVHTRNGGGNRECWQDDCDGQCTGCIQTDAIPALPTYIRDEDDDGDSTYANNYFRAMDPAAGLAALEAQEKRETLQRLQYFREAITAGKQPPWAVLSPVRGKEERDALRHNVQKLREQTGYRARDRRHAEAVEGAIKDGVPLPSAGMVRVPSAYYSYGTALKYRDEYESAAREARSAADTLASETSAPLPPAVTALVTAELEKLNREAFKREAKAAENQAKIDETGAVMKSWAGTIHRDADLGDTAVATAEAKLKDFDWAASYPGDAAECPPRPAED